MIAGQRRIGRVEERVTVDFTEVMRQAVENERWRVLRAVGEAIEAVPTAKADRYASAIYGEVRGGDDVKREIARAVRGLEVVL